MKNKEKKDWKLSSQLGRDMHYGTFIEAICAHGIGHHKGVHGCHLVDGHMCCQDCPPELWAKVSTD